MSVDFENDPELYGLRRSRRAHAVPERYQIEEIHKRQGNPRYIESSSEEEDEDGVRKARKKRRGKRGEKNRRDYYEDEGMDGDGDDDDEEEEEEEDDYYSSVGKKKKHSIKHHQHQQHHRKKKQKVVSDDDGMGKFSSAELRFSTRNSKVVNYNIDNDDEDFEESVSYQPHEVEDYALEDSVEVEVVDSIDFVLDHRDIEGIDEDEKDMKKRLEFYVSKQFRAKRGTTGPGRARPPEAKKPVGETNQRSRSNGKDIHIFIIRGKHTTA